ncbi:hypothetical protein [Caballeronia sp. BR00000012568055]|uniref:hypothetical protein n=1 Tax=Caballeronia sp. BR00000012568055 TaxID=2918761 RepID=UPI0023F7907F|nr:hypothetical protein [Caballeronia sp. BR00000012568055]
MTRASKSAILNAVAVDTLVSERGEAAVPHAAGLDAFARTRPLQRLRADLERLRQAVAVSTSVMVVWSLFEVPWEMDLNSSREQAAAVVAAKTMLLVIAGLSMRGKRWASYLLLFVCLTSVLAIAPELPGEFDRAPWLALLSTVELIAKLTVMVLLAVYLKFKASGKAPLK